MRIEYLYRYPVKGLTAEALEQAEVEPGGAIPWDRAFALAQGDSGFDPANPTWLPKWNFLCLMKNARAARLFSVFDPRSKMLRIRAPGRQRDRGERGDAGGAGAHRRLPDRLSG